MPLAAGVRLGAYEILSPIGEGGMGQVYRARDTRLDRVVAIKVLPARFAEDPTRRERFEREARAVAALNHPHICQLYDVGSADGSSAGPQRFLVMEYLEGQSLEDRIVAGPLAIAESLSIASDLADALDHAHRRGLVHRDLKPANVMLTKAGAGPPQAKLLDFGISRLQAPADLPALETVTENRAPLTADGAVLGTYPYMAPEQLAGREADARSDLFSFGAVLYEMVTGQRAFQGTTAATLIGAILHSDPPPLASRQPLAPPALERVVARCLAKDPDNRWQTARDLAIELQWVAERAVDPVPDRPRQNAGRVSRLVSAALAILVIVAASAVTYVRGTPADAPQVRLEFSPPAGLTLADVDIGGPVAISPDGQRLAFVAAGPDGRQLLWVRPLDSFVAQALPETDGATQPFWSPDNRSLGFFAQRKLKKIVISGAAPQTLCDAILPRGGAWSVHGDIVFAASVGHELYRVPAAGGVPVPLPADGFNQERRFPAFLPDGRHFVYTGRPQKYGVFLATLDSPGARLLLDDYVSVAYAAPGYLLALIGSSKGARAGTLMAQPFDPDGLETTGEPSVVAERIWYPEGLGRGAFSVSGNGTLVYDNMKGPGTRLTWFDRSGKPLGDVDGASSYAAPSLSPDEKKVVAERLDPETQAHDLWLIDTARGVPSRFTSDPAYDVRPVWSPDGNRIVFASPREAPPNLYQKAVSGGGEERLFLSSHNTQPTDWSGDGRLLAYASLHPTNHWDLGLLPMSSTSPADRKPALYLQSKFNEQSGQFSPDGRWLAYVSDQSGINEVYVGELPELITARPISSNGGSQPRWRADGRELFYVRADGTLMAVSLTAGAQLEPRAPVALFKTGIPRAGVAGTYAYVFNYDVSSDGQRFLINTNTGERNTAATKIVLNWHAPSRSGS